MIAPVTIEDLIKWNTEQEISFKNLHGSVNIVIPTEGAVLTVPLNSLMSKYRYFLEPIIVTVTMHDEELAIYQCNPKKLSAKLYNTTELWDVLLQINHCVSKVEFTENKIRVLDASKLRSLVNEILVLEKVLT